MRQETLWSTSTLELAVYAVASATATFLYGFQEGVLTLILLPTIFKGFLYFYVKLREFTLGSLEFNLGAAARALSGAKTFPLLFLNFKVLFLSSAVKETAQALLKDAHPSTFAEFTTLFKAAKLLERS